MTDGFESRPERDAVDAYLAEGVGVGDVEETRPDAGLADEARPGAAQPGPTTPGPARRPPAKPGPGPVTSRSSPAATPSWR